MDEWEAERDWRDDVSNEPRIQASAGLLRATLACGLVALVLALFVAPSVKREARDLAFQSQSGLDQMATGSIGHADPRERDPVARGADPISGVAKCAGGHAEAGDFPC